MKLSALYGAAFGLGLLLIVGVASADAAGPSFWHIIDWQRQHAVDVRVSDLSTTERREAATKRLENIRNVAFVEFDAEHRLIHVIPGENKDLDASAVRAAVRASGYDIDAAAPRESPTP
jgi:hypothetical protein